ncbi:MAG: dCMP deaminase family protein [Halobacteriales archaeon]|nr:dCMP deaminase family protein [Halobacteriales archaeon]
MDGERPSVDQYFMDMTHLVKARGTCPRRRVGAVIVKDKRVLTTGYNGAPRNFPHPIDVGCLRDELQIPRGMVADICPCLHAEQNAILQAATTGVSIEGADLFCTTQPCTQCSRMVANCGMRRVVFEEEYPDPLAVGILTTAGVELWRWDAQAKVARRVERPNTFEQAQDELRRRHREGTLLSTPRPGQLPMHTGALPTAHPPAPDVEGEQDAETAGRAGIRDVTGDPRRQEMLRAMAKEKAERRRKQQEESARGEPRGVKDA